MKLITRFELASRNDGELHAQQRESFNRWTIWLAIIWIILIDEAREREGNHKRRARPAPKPPMP